MAFSTSSNNRDYCICIGVHTRAARSRLGNFCTTCDKPFAPIRNFWPSQGEISRRIRRGESSEEIQHIYENIINDRTIDTESSVDSLQELTGRREYATVIRLENNYLQPPRVLQREPRRRTRSAGDADEIPELFPRPLLRASPINLHRNGQHVIERMYGNIQPPKFAGLRRDCVKLFFSQFRKYSDRLHLPEGDKVEYLGCLLDKGALELYDEILENNEEIGFNDLRQRMLDHFTEQESDLVTWNSLHSRKLRTDETVREYYDDIRRMNAKLETPQ